MRSSPILLTLLLMGCGPASKFSQTRSIERGDKNVLILMYHDIIVSSDPATGFSPAPDDVSLELFQQQLDWLQHQGYQTLSAYELYNLRANSRSFDQKMVMITFDDNYYGVYKHAVDELEKRGMKATIFAHTHFVRPEREVPKPGASRPKLSWSEMVEVETKRGEGRLFRFESHTVHHRNLTTLEPSELQHELCDSKAEIEERFRKLLGPGNYKRVALGSKQLDSDGNKVVRHIAYPFGAYNEAIGHAAKSCGYGLGYEVGFAESFGVSSMALPRLGVGRSLRTLDDFARAVAQHEQQKS